MQQIKKKYEKIELFFSARGLADLGVLSKSNPQCFVYLKEGAYGIEKLIGKTEVRKNNLNPDWKTTIVLDYIFEVNQYLRCVVMDSEEGDLNDNDTIGSLQTTVGQVMGSKIQVYGGELKQKDRNRGKLLIKAEKRKEIGGNNEVIFWQWYGEKIKNMDGWFGTSDPFLRFHKWHMNVDWLLVHETEFIKNNENPIWKAFQISLDRLFDHSPQQPFKIELWDNQTNGKHQFIGSIEVTIDQIMFQNQSKFEIKTPKGVKNNVFQEIGGMIGIKSFCELSFIDYLKGGEQINLSIAIDFTKSNRNLHFPPPGEVNQYQNAISQVSEILLHYDYDKKVPVYGFGGIPAFPNYERYQVDHCFALNGNQDDPEVFQLDGILQAYKFALQHVTMSYPTNFGPVIMKTMKQAEQNKTKSIYNVLLILTDGLIKNLNEIQNLIQNCSRLPLSIIIVGIGQIEFKTMKKLDENSRDLVTFVPFELFSKNPGDLARELLSELPTQLVEYKLKSGQIPQPDLYKLI